MTKEQKYLYDELLDRLSAAEVKVDTLVDPPSGEKLTVKQAIAHLCSSLAPEKPPQARLTRMLDRIDKFLSNHDGSYQADARALWHIIGGATRGPDDQDSAAKGATIHLRGLAFPRTAALGTGTGAAFTSHPKLPPITSGQPHFRQHALKAIEGLKRAGRVK